MFSSIWQRTEALSPEALRGNAINLRPRSRTLDRVYLRREAGADSELETESKTGSRSKRRSRRGTEACSEPQEFAGPARLLSDSKQTNKQTKKKPEWSPGPLHHSAFFAGPGLARVVLSASLNVGLAGRLNQVQWSARQSTHDTCKLDLPGPHGFCWLLEQQDLPGHSLTSLRLLG